MTGLLKDMLNERADSAGVPHVDLDQIVRSGKQGVRRRRTVLAGMGTAAVLALGLAAPSALDALRPDGQAQVADSSDARPVPLAWVSGSTLHRVGLPDADLGAEVQAWVWAGEHVVFTDSSERVHVWSEGRDQVVGTAVTTASDRPYLVADGTVAAWLDADGSFVAFDVESGVRRVLPAQEVGARAQVEALDGAVLHAQDARGHFAWDLADDDGSVTVSEADTPVMDAESGVVVRENPDAEPFFERRGDEVVVLSDEFANLSPDARFLSLSYRDEGYVLETATGRELPFDHDHQWAIGYEWLDTTTLAVMVVDGERARLIQCDVEANGCDEQHAALLGSVGEFQLPVGVHFRTP